MLEQKLYCVRIDWSQTDCEHIGVWATSKEAAVKKLRDRGNNARYITAEHELGKIIP